MERKSNKPRETGKLTPEFIGSAGRTMGCLGAAAGMCFGLIGISMLGFNALKFSKMESAEGVAIRYERGREGMRGPGPYIEFTVDKKQYVISGRGNTSSDGHTPRIKVGSKVGVLFNPQNPSQGLLDLFMEKWFTPIVFMVGGFGIACLTRIMTWAENRVNAGTRIDSGT